MVWVISMPFWLWLITTVSLSIEWICHSQPPFVGREWDNAGLGAAAQHLLQREQQWMTDFSQEPYIKAVLDAIVVHGTAR